MVAQAFLPVLLGPGNAALQLGFISPPLRPRTLIVLALPLLLGGAFFALRDKPPAPLPPASSFAPALPVLLAAARSAPSAPSPDVLAAFTDRRATMARLVREDPEAALAAALTPHEVASLPPDFQKLVERPLAGVGFYGVLAICSHGDDSDHAAACRVERHVFIEDREIPVAIYGSRRDRLTEEDASLYGVELDGVLALHADDAVVFPAERLSDDPAHAGHFAVIHRGRTTFFADRSALDAHLARLATP